MNHRWNSLKKDHIRKDYLDECVQCKARRIKFFDSGQWIIKYFTSNKIFKRFAPECNPVKAQANIAI